MRRILWKFILETKSYLLNIAMEIINKKDQFKCEIDCYCHHLPTFFRLVNQTQSATLLFNSKKSIMMLFHPSIPSPTFQILNPL